MGGYFWKRIVKTFGCCWNTILISGGCFNYRVESVWDMNENFTVYLSQGEIWVVQGFEP
jgi:hypothetical protein